MPRDNRAAVEYLLWLLIAVFTIPSAAQTTGAWTWMGGNSTIPASGYAPGSFGILGVAAPTNLPAGRVGASTWTDSAGNLWLFGGEVFQPGINYYNDLWKYSPASGEWTWMGGGTVPNCTAYECGQSGIYGSLKVPAVSNFPGGRYSAVSWTNSSGRFWIYGGDGVDSVGQVGVLNDLWMYNPATAQWAWISGGPLLPGNHRGLPGTYGTLGVPAAANNPGALSFANAWVDKSGNGWLFGGVGEDANGLDGSPTNVWQFTTALDEWTWLRGNSTFGSIFTLPSVYGFMGTPASANTPGSRDQGASWTDNSGNFWLFGGNGRDSIGDSGYLNELWMYNPSANQWTWVGGNSTMNCLPTGQMQNCGRAGVYGTLGAPAAANIPGGRTAATSWTDSSGNFWLFGGAGYDGDGVYSYLNDLWRFNPSTEQWAWMNGPQNPPPGGAGTYGSLGVATATNIPGVRDSAAAWTDLNGNFWLFGGNATDAKGNVGFPNDLWRYQPNVVVASPDFQISVTPAALVLNAGASAVTTISLTPENGFNSGLTLACSGLPVGVTCGFSPTSVTVSGSTVSCVLTVTASALAALPRTSVPLPSSTALAVAFCFAVGIRRRRLTRLAMLAWIVAALGTLSGCGSGSGGGSSPTHQAIQATVNVTATNGSLQHSASLNLTVE